MDQAFIDKMNNFNKQVKKLDQSFISDKNTVSQDQHKNLALKNLSSVYGRVKQKMNQNVSSSGP